MQVLAPHHFDGAGTWFTRWVGRVKGSEAKDPWDLRPASIWSRRGFWSALFLTIVFLAAIVDILAAGFLLDWPMVHPYRFWLAPYPAFGVLLTVVGIPATWFLARRKGDL